MRTDATNRETLLPGRQEETGFCANARNIVMLQAKNTLIQEYIMKMVTMKEKKNQNKNNIRNTRRFPWLLAKDQYSKEMISLQNATQNCRLGLLDTLRANRSNNLRSANRKSRDAMYSAISSRPDKGPASCLTEYYPSLECYSCVDFDICANRARIRMLPP